MTITSSISHLKPTHVSKTIDQPAGELADRPKRFALIVSWLSIYRKDRDKPSENAPVAWTGASDYFA